MLICRIKSSAILQYFPNCCHPHKFVPMWHSAERFAPWCFIAVVTIANLQAKPAALLLLAVLLRVTITSITDCTVLRNSTTCMPDQQI